MNIHIITVWLPFDPFIVGVLGLFAIATAARLVWRLIPVIGG